MVFLCFYISDMSEIQLCLKQKRALLLIVKGGLMTATNQAQPKMKLSEIFTKNLIIFMIVHFLSDCSNNMITAFINMGAKAAGISAAAIGLAASTYSIAALLMRMPAGNMTTTQKKRLLVIGVIVFRYLTSFLLGTLGMSSSTMFIIFRTINGLGWSIAGVVIPAIEATLLDKRAMGTTYAVYTALSAFAKGMVRSLGVSVYQSSGIVTATIAAGGFALAAILLVNFMNWNDEKLQRIKPRGNKKGLFSGVNKNYMGVCFLMGCAVVTWTLNQQFNNVLAQERGIDIATILAITAVISSVWGFAASALCDFIKPKYVLVFTYLVLGIGTIILGKAETYNMFLIGEILCTIGTGYSKIQTLYLYKACAPEERPSVHATSFFVTDIFSLVAGAMVGLFIEKLGYTNAYMVSSVFVLVAAVMIFIGGDKMMAKGQVESETAEA